MRRELEIPTFTDPQQYVESVYGDLTAQIVKLCSRPEGATSPELQEVLCRTANRVHSLLNYQMKQGRIIRAGVRPHSRYFTSTEHAKAYEAKLPEIIKAHAELNREKDRQSCRAYAARKLAERGGIPRPKKEQDPLRKPKRASTALKHSGIVWPDHVKVQVIPHGVDTRFKFTPPNDNWKGQITEDWMIRRLGSV